MRWTQEQYDAWLWTASKPTTFNFLQNGKETECDPGPESVLQGKIEEWAKEHGYPILSFHQTRAARKLIPPGWPDIVLILPYDWREYNYDTKKERVLFIELKSATGRLSGEQKSLRLQFMALGHTIYTLKSYRAFLGLVSIILK